MRVFNANLSNVSFVMTEQEATALAGWIIAHDTDPGWPLPSVEAEEFVRAWQERLTRNALDEQRVGDQVV